MRTNWKLSLGLALTLLATAVVVLIPTVASGRSDPAGARPVAHVMARHVMAGDEDALQDELAQLGPSPPASTTSTPRARPGTSSDG